MSLDHKPEDQIEFERIRKAGGRVTLDGRVNGGLNLSRAIGDHGYKMVNKIKKKKKNISMRQPQTILYIIIPEQRFTTRRTNDLSFARH